MAQCWLPQNISPRHEYFLISILFTCILMYFLILPNPEQGWRHRKFHIQGHLKIMPIQAPQWTEYLSCPVCENAFDLRARLPISISSCGHTVCKGCLSTLQRRQCPFDQVRVRHFSLFSIFGLVSAFVYFANYWKFL